MLTTGDFLWMARKNGTALKYGELKDAMKEMDIRRRARTVAGFLIRGYLTKDDVRRLREYFEIVLK